MSTSLPHRVRPAHRASGRPVTSGAPASATDAAAAPATTSADGDVVTAEGLHRSLKNRHIQMIAIGGAIGTGLFYGSASSIQMAGPAIILSYIIGGIIIFLVMRACGEMSVEEPVSGAFAFYAYKYWSPLAGYYSGWNYWFNYVAVSMAELTVVGLYVNFWFPGVPTWLSAAVFLVLVTIVNIVNVKAYGEFEFWFAIIKVVAICAMILFGFAIILFGVGQDHAAGFSTLTAHGGFFPTGIWGMISALGVVMFAFGGVELIAITAGEADNPTKTIPKAINQVIYRIFIFYVGAIFVMLCLFPWDEIGKQGSPFVTVFDRIGIASAATLLNIVVLTAAVSAYNSGLYSNGRMLYNLSREGSAPKFLNHLSKSGAPVRGVLVSSAVTALAVLIIYLYKDAFDYIMSTVIWSAVSNWAMITYTQIKYRQKLTAEQTKALKFKMPFFPVANWIVLIFFACLIALLWTQDSSRPALIIGPVWMCCLIASYLIKRRLHPEARDARRAPSVTP